ncbi:MAG: eccC5 [Planctomycetota bacterium]|nr:eccC5 [Planctomycetota bacterium]
MTPTSLQTPVVPEPSPIPPPSAEPEILRRERAVLHEILRLVAERAAAETKVEGALASNDSKADTEYQKTRLTLTEKYERLDREARAGDEQRRRAIVDAALKGEAQAKSEFSSTSRRIATEFDTLKETARSEYSRDKSTAETIFAVNTKTATKKHAEETRPINEASAAAEEIRERLNTLAASYSKFGLTATLPPPTPETYSKYPDPLVELLSRQTKMEGPLKMLEGLVIPKMTKGSGAIWLYLITILIPVLIAGGLTAWDYIYLVVATVIGVAGCVALRTWLVKLSRSQLARDYVPLKLSMANVDALTLFCRSQADDRLKQTNQKETVRRDEELKRVKEVHARTIAAGEAARDEKIRKISEGFSVRMVEIQTNQQREMRDAIDAHDRRMAELPVQSATSFSKLDEQYHSIKEQIKTRYETGWGTLSARWREGIQRVSGELDQIHREVDGINPDWDDAAWNDRPAPRVVPPVVRFGTVRVDLAALTGGISPDPRLMEGIPTTYLFPILRPFPAQANLLVEAPAEGRTAALNVLQTSMFRLLTSLPPAKVRFTIIDPTGIGRSFGAFMHLADFDGDLVTNQVWTDPRHIDERLTELALHMETVTQKYLRNEYATIEEYNQVAGEVAEPYRVLVVADFPTKFDEKLAGRIAAIAAGGVPCGVLTLMTADPSKPMPLDFGMEELRPNFVQLKWDGTGLSWDDPDFGRYPLQLDPPLSAEFATTQIQKVGSASTLAKRVEVPFEFIAPSADAWWTCDSRAGIDIPLGKAGATKRQHLALGRGTSQHVLIAGRTGSGKSTLMHALIVNLALNYSPDEIELYLIDFKKGVEFKVYATYALPHASVVAIESEREFGISVLQRIDTELRLRADRFRDAGVQDINGYRNAPGTPPLPRILLLVDEFQEFFVEEDKLAQEAALLLDRLVRQGRAFGVHVHLGSQSLGGAFTLARSTLGQMAVRIALQCSESDSHLILSEQNPAARLLSRPGEAIYNDANGAVEGNHFFQVVWLSDERREAYLKRLHELAQERKPLLTRTQIVFEGDAPAELARNTQLRTLLAAPAWPEAARLSHAWLGEAIAIKDPTSALFRRQGGKHLLIVGQQEEAAIGVVTSALVSLAAQFPPATSATLRSGARFFVLDGTPEGNPNTGILARVASALPHGVSVGGWRDVPRVLAEIDAELQRRKTADGDDGPEIFLFIHDLPNFRDLRRKEDDFSFSRKETVASPADQLDGILREGARLGLHLIMWCDTVNNLNRHFTHQILREIEMRVLFQMSPTDSGHLLDSPQASKLGQNRALFISEEQNRHEKFRPYGVPTDELLGQIREKLGATGRG